MMERDDKKRRWTVERRSVERDDKKRRWTIEGGQWMMMEIVLCVCGRSEEEVKSSVDDRERVCVRSEDKVKRSVYDRESVWVCVCVCGRSIKEVDDRKEGQYMMKRDAQ
jgi:CDGSH-type Zn-finger protein